MTGAMRPAEARSQHVRGREAGVTEGTCILAKKKYTRWIARQWWREKALRYRRYSTDQTLRSVGGGASQIISATT